MARIVPWAACAAGASIAAAAALYAVATASSGTARPLLAIPLPASYDQEAAAVFDADPALARQLSRQALSVSASDAAAWLRMAMLDGRRLRHATPQAVGMLQRSYDAAPYDPGLTAPRLAFAYQYWQDLPGEVRQEAQSEMRVNFANPKQRPQLMAAVMGVANPQNKLALAMELFRLRIGEIEAARRQGAADMAKATP